MQNYEGLDFGHYHLEHLINQGGFAQVYQARDLNLNRWVAIKLLKVPQDDLTDKELDRFLQEGRIMARLNHCPHVLPIYTVEFVSIRNRTIPYLVMEYAYGSLADLHPCGKPLPMDIIMYYLEQMVDGLTCIHDQGFVHLDIKPPNLLLGARDELFITDFGIAELIRSIRPQRGPLRGTALYTAPERFGEFGGLSSPATDQYAVGIILYEWLTGRPPFYGTTHEIMYKQLRVDPPSLREISPGISRAIEEVVLKALRKNPHERFKSVRELFLALDEAERRSSSFPYSLIAFIQKRA